MWVKICGITQVEQAIAIARLGATALGFICVPASPRYISPEGIKSIVEALLAETQALSAETQLTTAEPWQINPALELMGVFVDADLSTIAQTVKIAQLTSLQLHGAEAPTFCQQVRDYLPGVKVIKALRIRSQADLETANLYESVVDGLLLDAYHPTLLGGTGKTLDWYQLKSFRPRCPWLLAGGLTPENVLEALTQLAPDGIDLSSGVEISPGIKDLGKVELLFERLQNRVNVSV